MAAVVFLLKVGLRYASALLRRRLTSTRKFFTFNSGAKGASSPQVYLAAGKALRSKTNV
jgi:hypothetical protein